MKKSVVAAICTGLAGIVGLWIGAIFGVETAGAIIFSVATMGGFIISKMEQSKAKVR